MPLGLVAPNPFQQYELRMVLFTLRHLGLKGHASDVSLQTCAVLGPRRLSFAGFEACFPDFPLEVRTMLPLTRSYYAIKTPPAYITYLVTDLAHSTLGRQFQELREELGTQRRGKVFGLLFPFAAAQGGWLLHDGDFPVPRHPQRLLIESKYGNYHLDRYRNVLQAIVAGPWHPQSVADAVNPKPQKPPVFDMGLPVPPRTYDLVSDRIAASVLALLWQFCTRELTAGMVWALERREGERYVVQRAPDMASLLRLSPRAIQIAVHQLREAGLVTVRPGFGPGHNCSGYRLDGQVIEKLASYNVNPGEIIVRKR